MGGGAEVGHVQANSPEDVQHCRHKSEPVIKHLEVRCGFTDTFVSRISPANTSRQLINESAALEKIGSPNSPDHFFHSRSQSHVQNGGQKPASGCGRPPVAGVPAPPPTPSRYRCSSESNGPPRHWQTEFHSQPDTRRQFWGSARIYSFPLSLAGCPPSLYKRWARLWLSTVKTFPILASLTGLGCRTTMGAIVEAWEGRSPPEAPNCPAPRSARTRGALVRQNK